MSILVFVSSMLLHIFPARFIHTFVGWNCEANGGALYIDSSFLLHGSLHKICGFYASIAILIFPSFLSIACYFDI